MNKLLSINDPLSRAAFAVVVALSSLSSFTRAETITTAVGAGEDVTLRRGNVTDNSVNLLIKNQGGAAENNNNDRAILMKFDLSSLSEAITAGSLRLETPRGASTGQSANTFDAGVTLYLYGIPDGGADENFNPATVTWANSPYLTGTSSATNPRPATDLIGDNVNGMLATPLATFTWPEVSDAGDLVDFHSAALNAFLAADTNDVAAFILSVDSTVVAKTPVFGSNTAATLRPTLLTNADAVVPEPAAFGMALLALAGVACRRRR